MAKPRLGAVVIAVAAAAQSVLIAPAAALPTPSGVLSSTGMLVTGDWNGNGVDTIGLVRDDTWLLRNENSGGYEDLSFGYRVGVPDDMPVPGDWDSGSDDSPGAVEFTDVTFAWFFRNSNTTEPVDIAFTFS